MPTDRRLWDDHSESLPVSGYGADLCLLSIGYHDFGCYRRITSYECATRKTPNVRVRLFITLQHRVFSQRLMGATARSLILEIVRSVWI